MLHLIEPTLTKETIKNKGIVHRVIHYFYCIKSGFLNKARFEKTRFFSKRFLAPKSYCFRTLNLGRVIRLFPFEIPPTGYEVVVVRQNTNNTENAYRKSVELQ